MGQDPGDVNRRPDAHPRDGDGQQQWHLRALVADPRDFVSGAQGSWSGFLRRHRYRKIKITRTVTASDP